MNTHIGDAKVPFFWPQKLVADQAIRLVFSRSDNESL